MSLPIPQPPAVPLLGNIYDVNPDDSIASLSHLAGKYGPIFKLSFFGKERYFISSHELLNELCDEKRFVKNVSGSLEQVRNGLTDGLFTAYHGEPNWGIAHRTLVPAFGPLGIKDMFDEMYDIATQLVAKWARQGPDVPINVTDEFTRLTLDSIALCAMDKRFNSFYKEQMHPFVGAMVGFLAESGHRGTRTRLEMMLNPAPERQYQADIALMRSVAAEVVAHRRANPVDKKDLLNAMLLGKDPKTGQRLTDDNIMRNMLTFLVAGHETTSGLLSFASCYLMKDPEAMRKAQQEVDTVVGKAPVTFQHMSKFPYIEAVLRESLRLEPTAPAITLQPIPGTTEPVLIGGGKYLIPPDAPILALLPLIGRDPAVYGPDAAEFKPERMYKEAFDKLPPNAWKPFGNGARGCIGRPFAWQEAILALAMILQNFNIRLEDPSYQLAIKQTLTLKPRDLFMRATLREGLDPISLEKNLFGGLANQEQKKQQQLDVKVPKTSVGKPMSIFYGSNSGTCEGLAQTLAGAANARGYQATAKPLDMAAEHFPKEQPIVIISASYEGQPPDNAAHFVEWMKTADSDKIKDARYAVFGCGHHDWVSTFQKIPKYIDSTLAEKGARAITSRGETDVALGTVFDDFDEWQDQHLWPALNSTGDGSVVAEVDSIDMEISTSARASHLNHRVQDALVITNEILTAPGAAEKRHMAIKLPTNTTYEAGDYLAILPVNNIHLIGRVLLRFGLPWDATMTISKGSHTTIPTQQSLSVTIVLGAYVEMTAPASRKNVAAILQLTTDESLKSSISDSASGTPTPSVLELLESYPSIAVPFSAYLSMLPPMRIRQYSISSSPLADPTIASITFAVLDEGQSSPTVTDSSKSQPQHQQQLGKGRLGVATSFLRDLSPGSKIQMAIKKSHTSFHLPLDDATTPIIMVAAGTGIAPFRGFIQERAVKIAATNEKASLGENGSFEKDVPVGSGRGSSSDLAPALLFIGCHSPEVDLLYKSQLETWEREGAVRVLPAFSHTPEQSAGCKYAQDRVWEERELVSRLFDEGAQVYICGSGRLGRGVKEVAGRIYREGAAGKRKEEQTEGQVKEVTEEEAAAWWEGLRGERFSVDVFD